MRPIDLAAVLLAGVGQTLASPAPAFVPSNQTVVLSHQPLTYPPQAEAAGVAGIVVLSVTLAANGSVADAVATAGDRRLAAMAEASVRTWWFGLNGSMRAVVVYDFQLGGPGCGQPPASVFTLRRNVATVVGCARLARRDPGDLDDGGVAVVKYAPPLYPPAGLVAGRDGMVVFAATIDAAGTVVDVLPLAGDPLLLEDLEENLRTWQFEPGGSARRVVVAYELSLEPGRCVSNGFATRFAFRQRNTVAIVVCERYSTP